ncbi:MAG: hypothetical protein J6U97_00750 [Bacteroidaceae bacterium]|nr:hypothetical protein [Bacteroidaceae bacterium]
MNDEVMHRFFFIFTKEFQFIESQFELQNNQYDEFILGAATALFNIFRYEAYHDDALEFSDFLKRLNELAEQHIRECKAGENNA